ncbi:MAG: protein kinase [Deltaproteobacteria bacterium]|nr:protein kinase [Deltaproteobacteria bacterium]
MESFGKYRVVRPMKIGGTAAIYLAVMRGENRFLREVVIKRPLPHLVADARARAMFVDEAHIVSRLAHSNICQVLDLVARQDELYLVLEYLKGVDVREILRRCFETNRLIPPELAVYIGSEAASGLAHAHDAVDLDGSPLRLVHRDVSPKNIRVTTEGAVKVLDFGIAWASNRETETAVGTIKGTLGFMSPEQILGDVLDPRSDIFSFGIVLFQMLTGRNPFEGPTLKERVRRLTQTDAPPVSDFNAALDDDIQAIVARCLERDPAQRYQHMNEVRADLDTYLSRLHVVSPRHRLSDFLASLFPDLGAPDTDLQGVMAETARSETSVDSTLRLIFPDDSETASLVGRASTLEAENERASVPPPMPPPGSTVSVRGRAADADPAGPASVSGTNDGRVPLREADIERPLDVMATGATSGPFEAFVSKSSSIRVGAVVWGFVLVAAFSALFVVWRSDHSGAQVSAISLARLTLDGGSTALDPNEHLLEPSSDRSDASRPLDGHARGDDAGPYGTSDASASASASSDSDSDSDSDASVGGKVEGEKTGRTETGRSPHRTHRRRKTVDSGTAERDLTPARIYFRAAQRLDRMGRWDDARTLYVLAFSRAGQHPDSAIYLNLGLLHDRSGVQPKAAACLRAYLERSPSSAQAGAIRTKIATYGSVQTKACVDRNELSAARRKRLRQGPLIDQWIEEAKAEALR